jgi:hypothetical protein
MHEAWHKRSVRPVDATLSQGREEITVWHLQKAKANKFIGTRMDSGFGQFRRVCFAFGVMASRSL